MVGRSKRRKKKRDKRVESRIEFERWMKGQKGMEGKPINRLSSSAWVRQPVMELFLVGKSSDEINYLWPRGREGGIGECVLQHWRWVQILKNK